MEYRIGPGGTCPRCGEDRLTTLVTDPRRHRCYCEICAFEWVPPTQEVKAKASNGSR